MPRDRNSRNDKMSKDKYPPWLRLVFLSTLLSALAAFCVLYNRKEHSQGLSIIQKKFFKIHLCNFVRFQYIQADNRIRVIQWCWCSLHFRDKRGFLYIRQRLLNQI